MCLKSEMTGMTHIVNCLLCKLFTSHHCLLVTLCSINCIVLTAKNSCYRKQSNLIGSSQTTGRQEYVNGDLAIDIDAMLSYK